MTRSLFACTENREGNLSSTGLSCLKSKPAKLQNVRGGGTPSDTQLNITIFAPWLTSWDSGIFSKDCVAEFNKKSNVKN